MTKRLLTKPLLTFVTLVLCGGAVAAGFVWGSERTRAAAVLGALSVFLLGGFITLVQHVAQKEESEPGEPSWIDPDVVDLNSPSREKPTDLNDLIARGQRQ